MAIGGLVPNFGTIGFPGQFSGTGGGPDAFVRGAFIDAAAISRLAADVKSFRHPLEFSVDQVIVPSIAKNFAEEGRPPWEPLAPSTVKARGATGPILTGSGWLKKVATQKNMWKVTSNEVTFRAVYFTGRAPYGQFHQMGTRFMPQRVFIMLQQEDEDMIQKVFYGWLEGRIRRLWG